MYKESVYVPIGVAYTGLPQQNSIKKRSLSSDVYLNLKERESKGLYIDYLERHSISSEYRSRMVNWMIEVTGSLESAPSAFFLSVSLMDKYFAYCEKSLPVSDLHLIGVTAIYIASKHEDVAPLTLDVVYEKLVHRKFSKENIRKMEKKVLRTLEFDIETPLSIEFLGALSYEGKVPEVVRRKAEGILVLLQFFYNRRLLPSIEAVASLLVSAATLNLMNTLPEVVRASGFSFEEIMPVANSIYELIKGFPELMPGLESPMKFMNIVFISNEQRVFDM